MNPFNDLIPENNNAATTNSGLFNDLIPTYESNPNLQQRIQAITAAENDYYQQADAAKQKIDEWRQSPQRYEESIALNAGLRLPVAPIPEMPNQPQRSLPELQSDFSLGISYIRPTEFPLLINAIEKGEINEAEATVYRKLLADQLGDRGLRAFDIAQKTAPIYQREIASLQKQEDRSRMLDAAGRAFARSATLGYAYSPDEDRLNSDDFDIAAAERAEALVQETEGDNYWGSRIIGDIGGFLVPFAGAVKGLRALRAFFGMERVGAGVSGAVMEGIVAGAAVDLLTRPYGAENMTNQENLEARILQAGIGAIIGAAADAGLLSLSQWIRLKAKSRREGRLQKALETESKANGFDSADNYLDSLVELVETPDGVVVRPKKSVLNGQDELIPTTNAVESSSVPAVPEAQTTATPLSSDEGTPTPESYQPQQSNTVVNPDTPRNSRSLLNTASTIKGNKIDVEYEIKEIDELIVSHKNGDPNPDFPSELQPRDRARGASDAQINEIATNLRPDFLGYSAQTSNGAPIIGPDRVVESGNGRVNALSRAYDLGTADGYLQYLKDFGDQFGVDVSAIDAMKKPVLVRVRTTELDPQSRVTFVNESNQSSIASFSPIEQAQADVQRLSDDDILLLNPGPDGDLNASENIPFLNRFVERLGMLEAGGLMDGGGRANVDMLRRVRAAIFQKAYDDKRLISLMAEETSPDSVNLLAALTEAAPYFARARGIDPSLGGDSNILPDLLQAVDLVRQSRRDNKNLDELLNQGDVFNQITPETGTLARFISEHMRSSKRMARGLTEVGKQLENQLQRQSQGADMFGSPAATRSKILEAADRNLEANSEIRLIPERAKQEDGVAREMDSSGSEGGEQIGGGRASPNNSTLFSNPFGVASREIIRELGFNQGVAATAGGAMGGFFSEEEGKKWWLDVLAGAGAAAGASALGRYFNVIGRDGFLSKQLDRTLDFIDTLPWIGRGTPEIRELKKQQDLQRMLFNKQVNAVGRELYNRFTPSERSVMSDLIENRGVIKEVNLVHRQAAELDEHIQFAAERLKQLGMLDKDLDTGAYLHRYYRKFMNMDQKKRQAKKQSLSGTYSVRRGTIDAFEMEALSPATKEHLQELVEINRKIANLNKRQEGLLEDNWNAEMTALKKQRKALQDLKFKEYVVTDADGNLSSHIFAADEVPYIQGRKNNNFLSTDHIWSLEGISGEQATLHRDWTKNERQAWGEYTDAGYRYVRGMAEVSHDLALANFFKRVADNPEWVRDMPMMGWVQVPKQKVLKGSSMNRYGALAGKWVDPKIWAHVRNHGRHPLGDGKILKTYRKILNGWKTFKTVLNPRTHFNNIFSNTESYIMGGYKPKHIASAVSALREGEGNELFRLAEQSGLFGQDWASSISRASDSDMSNTLAKLAKKLDEQSEYPDAMEVVSGIMALQKWWLTSKQAVQGADTKLKSGKAVFDAVASPAGRLIKRPFSAMYGVMSNAYQLGDDVFKLAVFSQELSQGAAPREALKTAERYFFNYKDVPDIVKVVRDFPFGTPFVTYTYFALQAVARHAVQRPEFMLATVAAFEAINYAAYMESDYDDSYAQWLRDEDLLQPEWNKGRTIFGALEAPSLPFLEGYRIALGMSHILGNPFATEAGNRQFAVGGFLGEVWGGDLFGSSPFRVLIDIWGNEDWQGKEIYNPDASDAEKRIASLNYINSAWGISNPLYPGSFSQKKIIEGMANDVRKSKEAGQQPSAFNEKIVNAANAFSEQVGLEQFTGTDKLGNEILTRNAVLAAMGIVLRPKNLAQNAALMRTDIKRRFDKVSNDSKKNQRLLADKKITQQQYDKRHQDIIKRKDELRKELREISEAEKRLGLNK